MEWVAELQRREERRLQLKEQMEEEMRAFFEAKAAKEQKIMNAKKQYALDQMYGIAEKNQFKSHLDQMRNEKGKRSSQMNKAAEMIYVRAQIKDYTKLFVKKEQTEYRMKDYTHKAQYADEVIKKKVKNMKEKRKETD